MADPNDLLARLRMSSAPGNAGAQDTSGSPSASTLFQPQPQSATVYRPAFATSPPPVERYTGAFGAATFSRSSGLAASGDNRFAPDRGNTVNRSSSLGGQSESRPASERTSNLLNLLKFNRPTPSSSAGGPDHAAPNDLTHERSASIAARPQSSLSKTQPSDNPQEALLRLLNRPQSTSVHMSAETTPADVPPDAGAEEVDETSRKSLSQAANEEEKPIFTYANPFDQLAASSPINKIKKSPQQVADAPTSAYSTQNPTKYSSSPAPSPLPDGRTKLEALIGIGANTETPDAVASGLDRLDPHADRVAHEAIARAAEENADLEKISQVVSEMENTSLGAAKDAVKDGATQMMSDLQRPEGMESLERVLPVAAVAAFERKVAEIVQEGEADESSEAVIPDENSRGAAEESEPRIFQFPMRPYVAIDIRSDHAPVAGFKDESVIRVASLKREFDQVDRTLASATTKFIVYSLLSSKGGGFRVIRQDEGTSKHAFKKLGDSVFNLSISDSRQGEPESVLATDTNGSVYWTSIPISEPEEFDQEDLEARGLIFPPMPSQEDNTSGAQLKTRAKLSSRHPEFFAVGRGKSIHIVCPGIALNKDASYVNVKSRVVDSKKYLAEQCLKISTGKAGKDFTFSEDDTLIASLDKAGKLKFWDIREHIDLTNAQVSVEGGRNVDTAVPLLTLATCAPADKSWATSVQFIDKERPTAKGLALRYMLVGSKQNHSLQLWDLALKKPVQELNFPHENELDPICSVAYHAKSGVLTVGHPSRNSIYFIHISAPRYSLPSNLTQAEFIRRIAERDAAFPDPTSTAIMSGMREVSLANVGQLRSLEIMPVPLPTAAGDHALFELYVVHAKGVTCLTVTRHHVGIGQDGRPIKSMNAISEARISLGEVKVSSSPEESQQGDAASKPDDSAGAETKEMKSTPAQPSGKPKPPASPKPSSGAAATSAQNESVLAERKSSPSFAQIAQRASNVNPAVAAEIQHAGPVPPPTSEGISQAREPASFRADNVPKPLDDSSVARAVHGNGSAPGRISEVVRKVFGDQLDVLYRRIEEDKRVQEAAGAAKQDAVLRLVSSTLTDNVEKSLTRIITANIQESVLPSIASVTASSLDKRVTEAIDRQLQSTLPRELKNSLPLAISRAVQDPESLRQLSELVSSQVGAHVEQVIKSSIQSLVAPVLERVMQEINEKYHTVIGQQLAQIDVQRREDSSKMDHLAAICGDLRDGLSTLMKVQSSMQQELGNLQRQLAQSNQGPTDTPRPAQTKVAPPQQKDAELDDIATLMTTGRYEDGTIKWLQSARQTELFDKLFVQLSPSYLRACNQIVTLSVSAAVTSSLDSHIEERLSWLEVALSSIDIQDPEIGTHAPGVMDHLTQRLQEAYMQVAEKTPTNPALAKIHSLVRQVKEMKSAMGR